MECAVGIDVIEIARVRKVLAQASRALPQRVFTPEEVAFCRGRVPELAARFAAKEAVMKALGTGARGLAWREIEILPNRRGKPLVYLHGQAADAGRRSACAESTSASPTRAISRSPPSSAHVDEAPIDRADATANDWSSG